VLIAIVSGIATALSDAALVRVGETVWICTTALCRGLGAIVAISIAAVATTRAVATASAACLAFVCMVKSAAILVGDEIRVHVVQCRRQLKSQLLVTLTGVDGTVSGVESAIDAASEGVKTDLVWD